MNKLSTAKRIQIVTALVEGMGIRATARLCDVTKGAVSKLLADVGTIAAEYHDPDGSRSDLSAHPMR